MDDEPDLPADNANFTDTLFELCSSSKSRREDILLCLECGVDLTSRDEDSLTPLHRAAKTGNVPVCDALLEAAGDQQTSLACAAAPGHRAATPLHLAAVSGSEVLKVFLRHLGCVDAPAAHVDESKAAADPLGVVDVGGQTLLHYAAAANNSQSLELLLPLFSQHHGVDLQDHQGRTPLLCAAASNAVDAARVLLHKGAAPQLCTPNGWSPFHHAAMYDLPGMLQLLYEHTLNTAAGKQPRRALAVLDAPDALGCTPLHVAAEYGSVKAVEKLLELDSSAVKRDARGRTPLHIAANFDRLDAAARLLDAAARGDVGGRGAASRVRELQGANSLHDAAGWTPAHLAARVDAVEVLRLLRQRGHDMNGRKVPPSNSSSAGGGQAAEEARQPPFACSDGWTPLHCAVAAGAVSAVKALLEELGADPHLRGESGLSAYELLASLPGQGLGEDRVLAMTEAFLQVLHGPQELPQGASVVASADARALSLLLTAGSTDSTAAMAPQTVPAPLARAAVSASPFAALALRAAAASPGPATPPPAARAPASSALLSPPSCGSTGSTSGLTTSISPINWPWGTSPLNRAILLGAPRLVARLLETLPPRSVRVRLEEVVGGATAGGGGDSDRGPRARPGDVPGAACPRRRAVVDELTLDLESLTLSGATTRDAWRARRFGVRAADSNPASSASSVARPSQPEQGDPRRGQPAAGPAAAAAAGRGGGGGGGGCGELPGLPSCVRGLLAPLTSSDPGSPDARWPLFRSCRKNREQAFWLALEQARDRRVRWAALEIQLTPEADAADPARGGGHVWLGLADVMESDDVLQPAGGGLWMGSSSEGSLPRALLVDLAQQGRVVGPAAAGGSGGGGGWRLEKALQLPTGGGRAGVLWDLYGGTLLAVMNGGAPVVLADGLRPEPSPDVPPCDLVGGAAAPRMLVVGVQLPGWQLRLRGGRSGFSPGCGCVDDLLIAAEEQRGGRGDPWPSKEPSMTSLHFAAWAGNVAALEALVELGFSPDEPDADGWTPLHFAALAGQVRAVEALLRLGAAPDLFSYHGRTPCMMAGGFRMAAGGDVALADCLQLLVDKGGADLVHVRDERGRTLLMTAAATGNLRVVEWLLQQGVDPGATDCDGKRTLQYASGHNDVYDLIEHAVQCSVRNNGVSNTVGRREGSGDSRSETVGGVPAAGPRAGTESRGSVAGLRPWNWVIKLSDVKLLDRPLGEGSFGRVYAAYYQSTKVAVKELKPHRSEREQCCLEKELSVLQGLFPHERIATFIGSVDLCNGRRGLVFQRYDKDLQKLLTCGHACLNPRSRYSIALQIAEGLQFLHHSSRPIIHRDLKPDNVLLTNKLDVKLCDFGLSQAARDGHNSDGQDGYGHPYWTAPEVLQGLPYDVKVDVWSFGVILYQLATWEDDRLYNGMNPYVLLAQRTVADGAPPRLAERLPRHVAPEVAALVRECLSEEPGERPAMSEVVARLVRMAAHEFPGPGTEVGLGPGLEG